MKTQIPGLEEDAQIIMLEIPEQIFLMGDIQSSHVPIHAEHVKSFLMADTVVTRAQYEATMKQVISSKEAKKLPMQNISWKESLLFCNALSVIHGDTPAYIIEDDKNDKEAFYLTIDEDATGFMLPTEIQWEAAANGGKNHVWSGTSDEKLLPLYARFLKSPNEEAEVKSRLPNPFGIYYLSGLVWEWLGDLYDPDRYKASIQKWKEMPIHLKKRLLQSAIFVEDFTQFPELLDYMLKN